MAWNVGNIITLTLTLRDTRYENDVKNVMHYRVISGELSTVDEPAVLQVFASDYLPRFMGQLETTTYIRRIKSVNMGRPTDPVVVREWGPTDYQGSLISTVNSPPQSSACIVRQAYSRGRKSVGRLFFGPLPARFIEKGELVKDPTGIGDLQDVLDCLGDPFNAGDAVLRPIVCGAKATTGTPQMDVYSQRYSRLVTFMKSRRLNVGE